MAETNINDLFKIYIEKYQHATPVKCTVSAINGDIITVLPLSGAVEIKKVYFNKNFLVKVGSIVYITMLDDNIGFVSQYSELTEVVLVSDEFGGIPIADEITARLNKIEADINNLKTLNTAFVPVPGDGGAALKTTLAPWSSQQLAPTVSEALQNDRVKHGS